MYFPDDREENWSKLDLCVRVYSKKSIYVDFTLGEKKL